MTPTPDSEVDSVSEKSGKQLNQAPSAASQMNMRGVFLHVLADALGSVIVCASACVIMFTNFEYKDYVDPTLSVLMVTLIMYSTWGLLVESAMILLQTVPTHIQIDSLQRKLLQEVIELLLNVCLLFDCSGFSGSFMSLATFIVFKVSIEMSRINVIFQELQTRDFNFFLCWMYYHIWSLSLWRSSSLVNLIRHERPKDTCPSKWPLSSHRKSRGRGLSDDVLFFLTTFPLCHSLSLMTQIDGVLAVHEFHVWQLAGDRIIASAHIRCHNLHDYMQIAEKVKEFFHNEGIHSTTIQPEFIDLENENEVSFCLMVIVVSLLPELMRLLSSAMERNHYDDTASCLLYPWLLTCDWILIVLYLSLTFLSCTETPDLSIANSNILQLISAVQG